MKTNRLTSSLALCAALLLAGSACVDLEVQNLNAPDRERAIQTPGDVEALVSGAFQLWEEVTTGIYPNMTFSCVADSHSSSWGNFGMRDNCSEPRIAWNNSPSYGSRALATSPWNNSYGALAAVRDGLSAINDGLRIQEAPDEPDNTERLVLFGKLIQGLTYANLAVIFDKAFVVDENVSAEDLNNLEAMDYNGMWATAEERFAEVIQGATTGAFTIPSDWVAFSGDWDGARMAEVTRAWRTRLRIAVPRTPSERDALNWSAILADAQMGISETYGGLRQPGGNWVLHQGKRYSWFSGWSRSDYRRIGPTDASGGYQKWITAPLDDRVPFDIDTDDRRITGGAPDTDGKYNVYDGASPFPADRGIYHYSNYRDNRWDYLWYEHRYEGFWPDMTQMELDFIAAEANYRLGNHAAAMETVNHYRTTSGELPPFTDPSGTAPGGERCVPKKMDGSGACGNLFDALKHEKNMELYFHGMAQAYTDDRGWGDLVQHSWMQLPIPGQELELLLQDIYTFGGPGGESSAPDIIDDFTPAGIRKKLRGFELWREVNVNRDPDQIERRR